MVETNQQTSFVDLYLPKDQNEYVPPATEDLDRKRETHDCLQEIRGQELNELSKIANPRFVGV